MHVRTCCQCFHPAHPILHGHDSTHVPISTSRIVTNPGSAKVGKSRISSLATLTPPRYSPTASRLIPCTYNTRRTSSPEKLPEDPCRSALPKLFFTAATSLHFPPHAFPCFSAKTRLTHLTYATILATMCALQLTSCFFRCLALR